MNGVYRVRIIEDHVDLRRMVEMFLSDADLQVTVTDPDDFSTLLTPQPWENIDAALTDINLGADINGWDILAYLKEHHPHIRRIALTAYPSLTQHHKDLADVYLEKPVDRADVLHALGVAP